jgi:hypothetical protein
MRRPLDWLVVIISCTFLYFVPSYPDKAERAGLGELDLTPTTLPEFQRPAKAQAAVWTRTQWDAPSDEFREEDLYVVRVTGESAFAVKIERIDPLQFIDLSAPALHGEEHLLGLERGAAHLSLDRDALTSVKPR